MKLMCLCWICYTLSSILASLVLVPSKARALEVRPDLCESNILNVVERLVIDAFPKKDVTYRLMAFNEVRCEESEQLSNLTKESTVENYERASLEYDDMANVAVVVIFPGGETHFVVAHIHFSGDALVSAYPHQWTLSESANAWQDKWCTFISRVYPDELDEQQCSLE